MPKKKSATGVDASSEITDPRFSSVATNPRFRLPSKKQTRTKIDKRFSRLLTDEDFCNSGLVDRYGRKLNPAVKKKALERLYLPEEKDNEEHNDEESLGQIELESANEEEVRKELGLANKYDPARGGGFSSSEDEDSDDEDGVVELDEEGDEFPHIQAAQTTVEMGEVSSRFAVVNLDWDNIKSVDLFAVFSSFLPPGGKIYNVSIYPSEFGKERMNREELEGPPKEIFIPKEQEDKSEDDESEDDEKIAQSLQKPDDGAEYNDSTLRQYQLERLRYYYAVVLCSSDSTAQAIYEATDGREYLSSANFLDLRFVPDGVEFDDKPRDQCTVLPEGYRPTEFVTSALQHSKVKLTWDTDPHENVRKEAINRAFSGSRSEINENDLRAYLGSDSESDNDEPALNTEETPKLSQKELNRLKMRAALGLEDQESTSKTKKAAGPVGDMEVTFTAGLDDSDAGGVFQNQPVVEETTAERYVRLERERKAKRKERAKARREGRDPVLVDKDKEQSKAKEEGVKIDLKFDDPFFTAGEEASTKVKSTSSQRKADRLAKKEAKSAQAQEATAQKAQLELLMKGNDTENAAETLEHFDINEIARAEKNRRKKGKSRREDGKRGGLQESFEMDVRDPRFEKVFEDHEYAIDPSNPRFNGTEGIKKLLEEGRRKRNIEEPENGEAVRENKKQCKNNGDSGLSGLIERVKKSQR